MRLHFARYCFWGHLVRRHQVALEHLQLFAVLETDYVVVGDRAPDRHCRGKFRGRRLLRTEGTQRIEHGLNKLGDLVPPCCIVAYVCRHNFAGEGEEFAAFRSL